MREENACPSYLADLADILNAGQVAVLAAYVDESRQSEARVFVVAGYVFDPEGVRRFEEQWRRALDSAQLSRFHMSDFENRMGPYAAWRDKYRHEYLNHLIDIIKGTTKFSVAVAVDIDSYNRLSTDDKAVLNGATPYALAFSSFIERIANASGSNDTIAYVLDQAPKGQGKDHILKEYGYFCKHPREAEQLRLRIDSITWNNSTLVPHLQAADILAYEHAKEVAYFLGRSERSVRQSARILVTGPGSPPLYDWMIDDAYLQRLVGKIRENRSESTR
jgi:hypothetical protein